MTETTKVRQKPGPKPGSRARNHSIIPLKENNPLIGPDPNSSFRVDVKNEVAVITDKEVWLHALTTAMVTLNVKVPSELARAYVLADSVLKGFNEKFKD